MTPIHWPTFWRTTADAVAFIVVVLTIFYLASLP